MSTPDTPDPRRCCEARGLNYPDGRRVCWRHATDDDRTLLFDLDKRAAACGIKIDRGSLFTSPNNRRWPYGPNTDVDSRIRMLDWAEGNDLRLSAGRCMHWLRKGRCADRTCYGRVGGWMDHVTCWIGSAGGRVLVSQPYNLSDNDTAELSELSTYLGLTVEIHPNSWYGHGTTFVGVWWTGACDSPAPAPVGRPTVPPVLYVGGPLDGQTATRTGKRWSVYRDDDGNPIVAARGDRELVYRVNRGLEPRQFYAHQDTAEGGVYVHLTRWKAWQADQRRAAR